jgi:hypothetical protein
MCKTAGQPDRPQITIRFIRFSCWVTKATEKHTHTHRICNTYCFSTVYATEPPYYVLRTLPVLLDLSDQMCLGEKA